MHGKFSLFADFFQFTKELENLFENFQMFQNLNCLPMTSVLLTGENVAAIRGTMKTLSKEKREPQHRQEDC